jgi:hypothetical protein
MIDEEMIDETVLEAFHYKMPRRLYEYWNETYVGEEVKNMNELKHMLITGYEAYKIGIRDNEQQHEITCQYCATANNYTRDTGYKIKVIPC